MRTLALGGASPSRLARRAVRLGYLPDYEQCEAFVARNAGRYRDDAVIEDSMIALGLMKRTTGCR